MSTHSPGRIIGESKPDANGRFGYEPATREYPYRIDNTIREL